MILAFPSKAEMWPMDIAKQSLEQARAFHPNSELTRNLRAHNIRQLEKWLYG